MAMFIDARIGLVFGQPPGPSDVVLAPDAAWAQAHAAGCACCTARSPAALALDRLFLARVHGRLPWFDRVVVPREAEAAARAALADPLVAARFRPLEPPSRALSRS